MVRTDGREDGMGGEDGRRTVSGVGKTGWDDLENGRTANTEDDHGGRGRGWSARIDGLRTRTENGYIMDHPHPWLYGTGAGGQTKDTEESRETAEDDRRKCVVVTKQ